MGENKMNSDPIPHFLLPIIKRGKEGDADACYDIAEYYYLQKDYINAFEWYKATIKCKNPNPTAYFNLGYAYQYGEGTEKDMFAAFEAYQKAAEYNLPQALNNLAFFYEAGIVVSRDQAYADELCRKATQVLNNLQTELYKEKKENQKLQQQYQELQSQFDTAKLKASELESMVQKITQEEKRLQQEKEVLEKKITSLMDAGNSLSQVIVSQREEIEQLQMQNQ